MFTFYIFCILLFSQTINEQIRALEHTSPKMRVKMMNNIKKQLIKMNQKQRKEALSSLRKKLHTKQGTNISPTKIRREHRINHINIQNQMIHSHQRVNQHKHNGAR